MADMPTAGARAPHPIRNRATHAAHALSSIGQARAAGSDTRPPARWAGFALIAAMVLAPAGARAASPSAADAALQLADALYPGELEVHDTHLRKGYVEVVLAPKGDPVTRIRLAMDPDPADCRLGTPCETRLRRAYAQGIAQGQEMRTLEAAFRACGMPILAVEEPGSAAFYTPVLHASLTQDKRQQVTQDVAACAAEFRAQAQDQPWWATRTGMRVLLTDAVATPPAPLTVDAAVPAAWQRAPAYAAIVAFDATGATVRELAFAPWRAFTAQMQETVTTATDRFLRRERGDIQRETVPTLRQTRLDPDNVDVVSTYLLACTPAARRGERCLRGDVALDVRYDVRKDSVIEIRRVPFERDRLGSPELPPRP